MTPGGSVLRVTLVTCGVVVVTVVVVEVSIAEERVPRVEVEGVGGLGLKFKYFPFYF